MRHFKYTKDEAEDAIDQIVHDERHRAILRRRYHDKALIEPLAEEFGIEPRTVSDIIAKYRIDLEGFIKWRRNHQESFY
ncbi:MAG: hypothetical protein IJK29_11045 [Bacteroidales bacterium]|nr:hypothetical protein [Bacteroidales bacterium]